MEEFDGAVEKPLDVGGGFARGVGEDCGGVGGGGLADGNEELVDGHGGVNGDFSTVEGFEGYFFDALGCLI